MDFITEEQRSLVAQLTHFVGYDCNYVDMDTCIAILVSCYWDINDAYVKLQHTINNIKLNQELKLKEQERKLEEQELKKKKNAEFEERIKTQSLAKTKKFEFEEKIKKRNNTSAKFGELFNLELVKEDVVEEEHVVEEEEDVVEEEVEEDIETNKTKFKYHEGYS